MRRAGVTFLITFAMASPQTFTTPIVEGIAASRGKNYAAAEAAFWRAVRENPASSRAYKLLGMVYGTQDRYEEAVMPFEKSCALGPREEEASYLLGRTCYGRTDLLVTGVNGVTLYRNRGDGKFDDVTERAGFGKVDRGSVAAGWFDFDNDGHLDLFVVRYVVWDPARETECGSHEDGYRSYCHPLYYKPLPNMLFRNSGNGTFRDVSFESGIADLAVKA